jgi:hypothetical protein
MSLREAVARAASGESQERQRADQERAKVEELSREVLRLTADALTSSRQREEAAIRAKLLEEQLAELGGRPWWRRLVG